MQKRLDFLIDKRFKFKWFYLLFHFSIFYRKQADANMHYTEMGTDQARIFIDASQLYDAFREAYRNAVAYRGGMHWKKSKGKEYLFRSRGRVWRGEKFRPEVPGILSTICCAKPIKPSRYFVSSGFVW
jgi:hypothetical protein